eukprot:Em0014g866a
MSSRTSKVIIDSLEPNITCPVCLGRLVSPKILPRCGHCCCVRCLRQLATAAVDAGTAGEPATFSCPTCGTDVTLPGNDVERLQNAPFVGRLIDTIQKRASVQQHQQLEQQQAAPQAGPLCVEHEVPAKMFCFSCNQLVCSECILYLHKGHPYEKIVTASQKCIETLRQRADSTRELREGIMFSLSQVDRRREEIADLSDNVNRSVKKTFDDMVKSLQRRKEELLGDPRHADEAQTLPPRRAEAVPGGSHRGSGRPHLVLPEVPAPAGHRRDHSLQEAEPTEAANIGVQLWSVESFVEMVASQTGMFLSDAYGPGLVRAELGKRAAYFTIRPLTPLLQNPTITANLTSLVDSSVLPVTVVSKQGTAMYEASYHPQVRGRHQLSVEVNGNPISGNPFPVYVSIPPSQLKKQERAFGGVAGALHLTFNGRQQMVVTELGGDVVSMRSKAGKKISQLEGRRLVRPWGVAVDEEDCVYVSEEGAHCLSKFDAEGRYVKSSSEGTVPLDGPRGVRVVGDKVLVCDGNNRCVKVLSRELELVRTLVEMDKMPSDLAVSPNGLLYVTRLDSRTVEVFAITTGEHRYSVEHSDLEQPSGLYFDPYQGLLYVADFSNCGVFAFKPNGEFVSRFCRNVAAGAGEVVQLWGVALDEDGFVYLCDAKNSRILVY